MFWATHLPSSGAQKFYLQPLVLHMFLVAGSWAIAAVGNQKRMQNQKLQLQSLSSWWWAVCCPKYVEHLRNIGIINSTIRLHLVGSFYEFYITMHGSMNIKCILYSAWREVHQHHLEHCDCNKTCWMYGKEIIRRIQLGERSEEQLAQIMWWRLGWWWWWW
jgi:hypothetical protein